MFDHPAAAPRRGRRMRMSGHGAARRAGLAMSVLATVSAVTLLVWCRGAPGCHPRRRRGRPPFDRGLEPARRPGLQRRRRRPRRGRVGRDVTTPSRPARRWATTSRPWSTPPAARPRAGAATRARPTGPPALPNVPAWEAVNTQTSPGVFNYDNQWIMFYDAAQAGHASGHRVRLPVGGHRRLHQPDRRRLHRQLQRAPDLPVQLGRGHRPQPLHRSGHRHALAGLEVQRRGILPAGPHLVRGAQQHRDRVLSGERPHGDLLQQHRRVPLGGHRGGPLHPPRERAVRPAVQRRHLHLDELRRGLRRLHHPHRPVHPDRRQPDHLVLRLGRRPRRRVLVPGRLGASTGWTTRPGRPAVPATRAAVPAGSS